MVEAGFVEPIVLTPLLVNDVASSTVSGRIYEGLSSPDPRTGEIVPDLGSWTVSADGRTYEWAIDPKAAWSDGRPVTGADYLVTVKAVARSKRSLRGPVFADIDGFSEYRDGKASAIRGVTVDPNDPRRFSVRLVRVFCPALANVFGAAAAPLPAHVFARYLSDADASKNLDEAPENTAPPVASGPFKLKEWRKGDVIVLERNGAYFKGAPLLDQYVYKLLPDTTVAASQLRSGEISLYTVPEPKDLDALARIDGMAVYRILSLSYTYVGWNVRSATAPALADKRVRQALASAVDVDGMIRTLLAGQAQRVNGHISPASWAAPDPKRLTTYAYDRSKAEQLLRAAGYAKGADGVYAKDGKRLSFSVLTNAGNRLREAMLQVLTASYADIGVSVTPRLDTFDGIVDKLTTGSPEIEGWILGWSLNLDPDPYGSWHSSQIPDPAKKATGYDFGGFTTPALDRAIEEGRTPASGDCTLVARRRAYETFERTLSDERPYVFGFAPYTLLVAPKTLRGLDPGTFSIHWNIEKWWSAR